MKSVPLNWYAKLLYIICAFACMYWSLHHPAYNGNNIAHDVHNTWLLGYSACLAIYGYILLGRYLKIRSGKNDATNDKLFMSLLLSGIIMLMFLPLSGYGAFMDENDNIRGGMIIDNGGILYKDYIVQHPPIMYYLCALFAFVGAESVQQFRLLYYVFIGLIWGCIYYRYSDVHGYRKIFLLPIIISLLSIASFKTSSWQILSDNFEAIGLTLLMLEAFAIFKRKDISLSSAVILSLGVFICMGTAFVSAYPISIILGCLLIFFLKLCATGNYSMTTLLKKGGEVIICMLLPVMLCSLYFIATGTSTDAFDQIYRFNREVYPSYSGGFGNNIFQPYIFGLHNFFLTIINYQLIAAHFPQAIIKPYLNQLVALFIVNVSLIFCLWKTLRERKYLISLLTLLATTCAFARQSFGFHIIPGFYLAITAIILLCPESYKVRIRKVFSLKKCIFLLSLIYLISAVSLCHHGAHNNNVNDLEEYIISHTQPEEGILIDGNFCDSIYLLAEHRYPVNRAFYILPWYMDWYEPSLIDDLESHQPNYVIYNEDAVVWNVHSHFAPNFTQRLKQEYHKLSENRNDGWKYYVWEKNPQNQ